MAVSVATERGTANSSAGLSRMETLPKQSRGCPCLSPGLENRAGKSEGFWLISDAINQEGKK